MLRGLIEKSPLQGHLAAISVGMVEGEPRLDLCYAEDSVADVDMNVVMTESGKFVEVQGTAEKQPFSRDNLGTLLGLAESGIRKLISIQKEHLGRNIL